MAKKTHKIDTNRMIAEVANGHQIRGFGLTPEPAAEEKRATLDNSIRILRARLAKDPSNRALPGLLAFHEAQQEALEGKIADDIESIKKRSAEIKATRTA